MSTVPFFFELFPSESSRSDFQSGLRQIRILHLSHSQFEFDVSIAANLFPNTLNSLGSCGIDKMPFVVNGIMIVSKFVQITI